MMEIRAERAWFRNKIEIAFIQRENNGKMFVGLPIVMREAHEGEIIEPSLSISFEDGQMLIDELWRSGLRPSEGSGSAGSLAATERHLKDMQAIAMGLLRKDGTQV